MHKMPSKWQTPSFPLICVVDFSARGMSNEWKYELEFDLFLWMSLKSVQRPWAGLIDFCLQVFSPFSSPLPWFVWKLGLLSYILILVMISITKSEHLLNWLEIILVLSGKNVTIWSWFIRAKGWIPLKKRQVSGLFAGKRSNLIWCMWWSSFWKQ